MSSNQASIPIFVMARVLGVSRAGFYASLDRPLALQPRRGRRGAAAAGQDGAHQLAPDLSCPAGPR